MSCLSRSRNVQPHISRTSSLSLVVLPSALKAAQRASSTETPFPCCSSVSKSRSERSSRSRSFSRSLRRNHRISALLGRPHDLRDGACQLPPFRLLGNALRSEEHTSELQ